MDSVSSWEFRNTNIHMTWLISTWLSKFKCMIYHMLLYYIHVRNRIKKSWSPVSRSFAYKLFCIKRNTLTYMHLIYTKWFNISQYPMYYAVITPNVHPSIKCTWTEIKLNTSHFYTAVYVHCFKLYISVLSV